MDMAGSHEPPNRGPAVFAVTTATLVLATVFIVGRIVCRLRVVDRLSLDDKVMVLAWLLALFLSFTIDFAAVNGLGKHDDDISRSDFETLRRCEYGFSILYNPALMATKTSILIFYLRLAKNTQVVLRYASWATLVVVNLSGCVLTFMNIFQCSPIGAAWMADFDRESSCIPLLTEFICAAPVNIVTDLAILALPIPVLTGMRLPMRQKTILVMTFTVGAFVSVIDVVRIYYLQRAVAEVFTGPSTSPESRFGGQADFAWNASLSLMWSAVEVNVGMACACVPALKPLILKLLPSTLHDPGGGTWASTDTKRPSDLDATPFRKRSSTAAPALALESICLGDDGPSVSIVVAADPSSAPDAAFSAPDHPPICSPPSSLYFGFVNISKPRSLLRVGAAESLRYCTLVSVLFFLWGISYGLLRSLNNAVAGVNRMSSPKTLGLTSAYFGGGYFLGPLLVGGWILRRDEHHRSQRHGEVDADNVGGFKATFIVGLCIYGIGTIIFWPSAVTNSYGGFMLSNFVVGFGLSVLEVGANTFMVLCGPAEFGPTRLLLAQAVQGVGSVLSGLLADKVFFKNIANDDPRDSMTLINVQWTYLGITLLCVVLGLFFFYVPLPEVGDEELERAARRLPVDSTKRSVGGLQLRTVCLVLAVVAQCAYVAAQEGNNIFFRTLLASAPSPVSRRAAGGAGGHPSSLDEAARPLPGLSISIADFLLVGRGAFALSRFLLALLTHLSVGRRRLPQARTYLGISIGLCFASALVPVVRRPSSPNLLAVCTAVFFFAEGPIWPLIFAIGLQGQGSRTKRAATLITMGAAGGGVFPFVMYGIVAGGGGTVQTAYVVVVALQLAMMAYPLFLKLSGDARRLVDDVPRRAAGLEEDEEMPTDEVVARRHRIERKRMRRGESGLVRKASRAGLGAKLVLKLSHQPDVDHHEGDGRRARP
ncbi:hypothetical protein L249_4777 [Ophiocordyceps polyrhachis-furcata BCC 54312]|uniref:Rhodopsin domain-containing protein n=1 Tax=Ophiocordyceps polyrhachis-furcata BCC 54312 TaxID=1330021 RepID=A0A367L2B1_9HYPO|nr:hypothetical protein L249_4777 [Ophiocordyceps polyrhachis-furcata BCC 54312]